MRAASARRPAASYRLGEREAACRVIGDIAEKENDGCLGMPEFLRLVKEAQAKMVATP